MGFKRLLLSWQVLLLLFCIVGSIAIINPKINPSGVIVTSVGTGAFEGKIDLGTVIYSANMIGQESKEITNLIDLLQFQGERGYLNLNTDKGTKNIKLQEADLFNISIIKTESSNLKFGLDIDGGIRALLESVQSLQGNETNVTTGEIISVLETRINVYGLRQAEFRELKVGGKDLIMVQIAGGTRDEIIDLLSREGNFEAKIPITVKNSSYFTLGNFVDGEVEDYLVEILDNTTIKINENIYSINDTFVLKGIEFNLKNLTSNKVVIEGLVYTTKEITSIGIPASSNYFGKTEGGYKFQFGVVVSPEGAKKFAEITQNSDKIITPGGSQLSERIYFYLDGKETDALTIAGDLKGREIMNPIITGHGETEEEARQNMNQLKAVLKSGNLPVELKVVSMDQLSATLGGGYLYLIAMAGLTAIFLISAVIYIRYRNLKISAGVMMTMLAEAIIIFGFAALTGWNLSTLAFAGIVAAIGFGVDDQILIIDETRNKKERYSLKEGLKRAFFMIFGAGATTICAMLPILFAGFGVYKEIGGFALTTIIGVLVGILITRPAFSKYVEYVLAD
ncbi:MAG: MMPL family transporter [Candidatus Aenigmarchaeota archaeon]|nr:MMPL family transporter [Candidatus Aenigmarchaeota archaeon]